MTNTEDHKKIVKRSPVICIMGHIDHGKSTLLDYIRKTNIVDTEAGGITQRISAYEVLRKGPTGETSRITFLDTPGHEAFGAMRTCGATIADVAVLVVSAEDGVKKQTLEALTCIQENHIPFIIAINKIDKPDANIEKTKNTLIENGIYIEGYGGDIPAVSVSSKTGEGVDELLDMMLLVADMQNLTGDASKNAEGIVLEGNLDKQKGITATLVIKDGSIESGMYVVCGDTLAPTRIMEDFLGKPIKSATFSSPIRIVGFDKLPSVGSDFLTFATKKEAEQYVAEYKEKNVKEVKTRSDETDEDVIKVIVRAQVAGAIEAIKHEFKKIKSEKIKIVIISAGIGDITEADVKVAVSSGKSKTVVVGFDVRIDASAKDLAERNGVEVQVFDIIYKITEWLQEIVDKNTPKVMTEEITAKAKVLKLFIASKDKYILGGRVESGVLFVGDDVKITRKEVEIGRGKIKDLQREKNKAEEVREGVEFGCQVQGTIEPAPGDKLEAYRMIEK